MGELLMLEYTPRDFSMGLNENLIRTSFGKIAGAMRFHNIPIGNFFRVTYIGVQKNQVFVKTGHNTLASINNTNVSMWESPDSIFFSC